MESLPQSKGITIDFDCQFKETKGQVGNKSGVRS
jgi:hypothetical protein